MKTYAPRAGSVPARVLAYFAEHPNALTSGEIAAICNIETDNVHGCLASAISHGVLVKSMIDGKLMYEPGDGQPPPAAGQGDDGAAALARPRRAAAAARQQPREAEEPASIAPAPIAALFSDGDLVLYGICHHGDDSAIVTEGQAYELRDFLVRVYPGARA